MPEQQIPPPGSVASWPLGCRCEVVNNGFGKGYVDMGVPGWYYIAVNCPLHWPAGYSPWPPQREGKAK